MDLAGSRILVVDDDPTVQALFGRLLGDEGYQTDSVSTGAEAFRLMEGQEYNLFIIDKTLPDMSGVEVVVRARSLHPESEVIVITANASCESAVATLRLGVFDYLEKPFNDVAVLAEKVRRALEKQRLFLDNKVLADHLSQTRDELNEMRGQHPAGLPERPAGEIEKINRYVEEMVDRFTMEMREEQIRLRQALNQIARCVSGVRAVIDALAEDRIRPREALDEIDRLVGTIERLAAPPGGTEGQER